jgi:hypothetical protein
MNRYIVAIAALAAFAPLAAHAESFTFTTQGKVTDMVLLPAATPAGRPEGAEVFTATTQTTYPDGQKVQSSGKCATWVLPEGSQFGSNGVCAYSDANGPLYKTEYSCDVPQKDVGANCWGRLTGLGGAWKGRTGTFALFNKPDGTSSGTGQWN